MSLNKWIVFFGATWACPALSAEVATPLPVFEFKGFRADQAVNNPRSIGLSGCSRKAADWTCITPSPLAGSWSVSTYDFIGGYLRSVSILAPRSNYEGIRLAFEAKYGTPCKTIQTKWQNRAGASLDNTVTTWCFNTGNLTLYEIGDKITNTQGIYTDATLLKEREKPIVDF